LQFNSEIHEEKQNESSVWALAADKSVEGHLQTVYTTNLFGVVSGANTKKIMRFESSQCGLKCG
jgi:hypothetical protein